jgi:gp16 family phage-associated protein
MHTLDLTTPLSADEIRQRFDAAGVSVSDWAQAHGLERQVVYSLLAGRTRGRRGEAHRAAVALGMKRGSKGLSLPLVGSASSPVEFSDSCANAPNHNTQETSMN